MTVEDIYVDDVVSLRIPGRDGLVLCRVTMINADNVMTGLCYDENGLEKCIRIDDVQIEVKKIERSGRQPGHSERRAIVFCYD